MEADIYPGEEVLNNPEYELKDVTYNVADEIDKGYNTSKSRYTNVRTNVLALFPSSRDRMDCPGPVPV